MATPRTQAATPQELRGAPCQLLWPPPPTAPVFFFSPPYVQHPLEHPPCSAGDDSHTSKAIVGHGARALCRACARPFDARWSACHVRELSPVRPHALSFCRRRSMPLAFRAAARCWWAIQWDNSGPASSLAPRGMPVICEADRKSWSHSRTRRHSSTIACVSQSRTAACLLASLWHLTST